jgi:hypothetical protein
MLQLSRLVVWSWEEASSVIASIRRVVRRVRFTTTAVALGCLLSLGQASIARADEVTKAAEDLRSGSDFRLRVSAALALGKSKSPLARGPLEEQLAKDDQEAVRAAAAAGLGALGEPAAVPALERAAANDKSSSVRETAKASLEKLRSSKTSAPAGNARVLVKIGKLLNKSGVKGADMVGRFKGATRAEAQKIPGVEVLADGADARAAGKSRGLPVLVLDGTLRDLSPRGKGGLGAEVEYIVKREQSLKGSVKGKGAVEDGASTRDAAAEKELQDQAMAAAVESALRGAPAVILASVQ